MAKVKYFYQKKPLIEWAKENNYSYSSIINFMIKEKDNYPNKTELIEAALSHLKSLSNYTYQGVLFKDWCKNNNYSYNTAMAIIYSLKDKYETKELLVAEAVKLLKTKEKKIKYYYKNIQLRTYCLENNLEYQTILGRIEKLLKENTGLTEDQAVIKAIESYQDKRCTYYYQGISLKKYCEKHQISYQAIYKKLKGKSKEEAEKLIAEYLKSPKKIQPKTYNINGMSLKEYCSIKNYNYQLIKKYLRKIINSNENSSKEEAVKQAIYYYEKNNYYKEEYLYQGQELKTYCKKNNYDYQKIYYCLKKININNKQAISNEEMDLIFKLYRKKENKDLFKYLKEKKEDQKVIEIATKLNIDLNSLKLLVKHHFSLKKSLYLIWYFGSNLEKININEEQLQRIINLKDLKDLNLNELIGLYKADIINVKEEIITYLLKYSKQTITSFFNLKSLTNNEIEELEANLNLLTLEFLEQTTSRTTPEVLEEFNDFLKCNLKILIIKSKDKAELSLSDNSKYIEYHQITQVDTEYLSPYLLDLVTSLPYLEQKVIIYLYLKQYKKEVVSKILNIEVADIIKIEESILNYLKTTIENEKILEIRK